LILVINCDFMLRAEWIPRPQTEYVVASLHLLGQDAHVRLLDEFELDPDVSGRELVAEVDHTTKLIHSLSLEKEVGICSAGRVLSAD